MTSIIDAATALALLEAAVELGGADYIYEPPGAPESMSCKYAHGDNPGCIVGVALSIHGVPLTDLAEWDAAGSGNGWTIGCLFGQFDSVAALMSAEASMVFGAAQAVQDRVLQEAYEPAVMTWGAALEAAREYAATLPDVAL